MLRAGLSHETRLKQSCGDAVVFLPTSLNEQATNLVGRDKRGREQAPAWQSRAAATPAREPAESALPDASHERAPVDLADFLRVGARVQLDDQLIPRFALEAVGESHTHRAIATRINHLHARR